VRRRRALAASIREAAAGKIVVDVTNPARADYSGLVFDGSSSAAEQFAAWLPGARVVKAFNTVFAANQANPVVDGTRLDAFVAGDDADAKATVLDLARSAGFEPIDAGDLAAARLLEALAWLNISLNLRNPFGWHRRKLVGTPVVVALNRRSGQVARPVLLDDRLLAPQPEDRHGRGAERNSRPSATDNPPARQRAKDACARTARPATIDRVRPAPVDPVTSVAPRRPRRCVQIRQPAPADLRRGEALQAL
jgi:hypothetical protein